MTLSRCLLPPTYIRKQEHNSALFILQRLNRLPTSIHHIIGDYMWGAQQDWKRRLNIVHLLPTSGIRLFSLRDVNVYKSHGNIIESEDCLYCSKCGEKNVWAPLSHHMSCCLDCHSEAVLHPFIHHITPHPHRLT